MLLANDTFFTTYTKMELEDQVKNALCDLWLNLEPAPISSHPTAATYTASTCATTTTAHAGATSQKSCDDLSDFLLGVRQGKFNHSLDCTSEREDFADPSEVAFVIDGSLRKSVRFSRTPSEAIQEALTKMYLGYSDWEGNNFIIYKQEDPIAMFDGERID